MQIAPESQRGITGILVNKGFRSLWLAQVASQFASSTLLFVLALELYRMTKSNTAVSGLFLVYGIPAVVFGMIAGSIVDKFDSRKVLMSCDISRAFIISILILLPGSIPVFYVLTFLNAIITQFYVPSEAPTIPRLVKSNQIVSANSLFSFTYYSSLAVGSVCAGPLLKTFHTQYIYIILVCLYIFAAFNISRIKNIYSNSRELKDFFTYSLEYLLTRLFTSIKEGIAYVSTSGVLKDALTLLLSTQVIIVMLGTLGPGFADRLLEIDVTDSSLVIMGPAVAGIILGALWVGNYGYRFKPSRLIHTGILSAGIILVLLAVFVRLSRVEILSFILNRYTVRPLTILLFFLLGIANSLLDVPANSVLQKEAEGDMRGRVYGVLTTAVGGLGIVPVMIGGILADTFGVGKVVLLLGIIVTWYGIWRIKYSKAKV